MITNDQMALGQEKRSGRQRRELQVLFLLIKKSMSAAQLVMALWPETARSAEKAAVICPFCSRENLKDLSEAERVRKGGPGVKPKDWRCIDCRRHITTGKALRKFKFTVRNVVSPSRTDQQSKAGNLSPILQSLAEANLIVNTDGVLSVNYEQLCYDLFKFMGAVKRGSFQILAAHEEYRRMIFFDPIKSKVVRDRIRSYRDYLQHVVSTYALYTPEEFRRILEHYEYPHDVALVQVREVQSNCFDYEREQRDQYQATIDNGWGPLPR